MSAAWVLPIVSSVVAAASGGVIFGHHGFSPHAGSQYCTRFVRHLGTGVPLACFIVALWLYRTAVYGVPAAAALPSVFVPLGPCGQGSSGIILLGRTVRELAYGHPDGVTILPSGATDGLSVLQVADAVYAGGLVSGIILWGLGLC